MQRLRVRRELVHSGLASTTGAGIGLGPSPPRSLGHLASVGQGSGVPSEPRHSSLR